MIYDYMILYDISYDSTNMAFPFEGCFIPGRVLTHN